MDNWKSWPDMINWNRRRHSFDEKSYKYESSPNLELGRECAREGKLKGLIVLFIRGGQIEGRGGVMKFNFTDGRVNVSVCKRDQ